MHSKYTKEEKKILSNLIEQTCTSANRTMGNILIILVAFGFVSWGAFMVGIVHGNSFIVRQILPLNNLILAIAWFLCLYFKGKGRWLREVIFFSLLVFVFLMNIMLNYKCYILYILPIMLSMRYNSIEFTVRNYIGVIIITILTEFANAYLYPYTGFLDLSTVEYSGNVTLNVEGYLYDDILNSRPDSVLLLKNGLRAVGVPYTLLFTCIIICAVFLLHYTESLLLETYRKSKEEARIREELAETSTKLMLSQIKPHFIYNTLSSISALCEFDPEEAQRVTDDFASYLRGNLNAVNSADYISFTNDLKHTKVYVNIEKTRFDKRLNVIYDIKEQNFNVPPLTLQPIVENAIKHGVMKKKEGGTVWITTLKKEKEYQVIVKDNGVGFHVEDLNKDGGNHLGIMLVKKRLIEMGGNVIISSEINAGTTVTLHIPILKSYREE